MKKQVIQEHETHAHQAHHETDELLTVREVAKRLRVDDTTVRRWIKNAALEAIRLPHIGKRESYRISRATLDLLLAGTGAQS